MQFEESVIHFMFTDSFDRQVLVGFFWPFHLQYAKRQWPSRRIQSLGSDFLTVYREQSSL